MISPGADCRYIYNEKATACRVGKTAEGRIERKLHSRIKKQHRAESKKTSYG